ncbi:MAG TPA: hypothetical protein VGR72_09540 [Candidatus Acidoferrales bacterium]|nr:hypothetical protein [Candidatus Acidoferrales bacterium]
MRMYLGRHVLGVAAILLGGFTLAWHGFYGLPQIWGVTKIPHREILSYIVAAVEIFGGVAIQWPKTERAGAIALAGIFFTFALFMLPYIIAKPKAFGYWDGFFEPLSQAAGALIVFATVGRSSLAQPSKLAQFGYKTFAVCLIPFTLAQVVYLAHTAELVPKWLPPGQMFWTWVTTIAFALAAIALLSGRVALLASRLLTAMLLGFWVLVWLPISFATPHSMENWSENVVTLSVTGAAWIVADYLSQRRSASPPA